MKLLNACLTFIFILIFQNVLCAQSFITRDIKSFGAKGDGKTNDHDAFEKAASFFNNRGGNGKLVIAKGKYIVGKQTFTGGQPGKPAYDGEDVLHFTRIKNFTIQGTSGATLKYRDSLRFGAFDPSTGLPYEHGNNLFVKFNYIAIAGNCILLDNCSNVTVTNLVLDGNNQHLVLGGVYGDVGRQVPHNGIFIKNSNSIAINNVDVSNFGLDGITVSNKASKQTDSISIVNSSFQYNARQGLSWVGGNNLYVKNSKFNNTGKGAFSSAPAAGVDIEAEVGPVRNGVFEGCEFINNAGLGVGADSGDSGDCIFTNCTFWGTTSWALFITKPGFTFKNCNIYGSFANGYNSPDEKNATTFSGCTFEDKPYNGKEPYGKFLIESNNRKRVTFTDCKFIANKKKLCWISMPASATPEEKYQFNNCSFVVNNASYSHGDFVAVVKGIAFKNCTFDFKNPEAKGKGYLLSGYSEKYNADLGGNKIIYSGVK